MNLLVTRAMRPDDARFLAGLQDRLYEQAGPGILQSYPKARAMDSARLTAFLDGKRYAVLATSRNGRPHAAPIAFTVWDGAFWVASVRGTRLRNLRARPYASIVVMEGEGRSHRAVVTESPVTLHEAADLAWMPVELREAWQARHRGLPTWAATLIRLRPNRLFSYDATGDEGG